MKVMLVGWKDMAEESHEAMMVMFLAGFARLIRKFEDEPAEIRVLPVMLMSKR